MPTPLDANFNALRTIHSITVRRVMPIPQTGNPAPDMVVAPFDKSESAIDRIIEHGDKITKLIRTVDLSILEKELAELSKSGASYEYDSDRFDQICHDITEMYMDLIKCYENYEEKPKSIDNEKHEKFVFIVDEVLFVFMKANQVVYVFSKYKKDAALGNVVDDKYNLAVSRTFCDEGQWTELRVLLKNEKAIDENLKGIVNRKFSQKWWIRTIYDRFSTGALKVSGFKEEEINRSEFKAILSATFNISVTETYISQNIPQRKYNK